MREGERSEALNEYKGGALFIESEGHIGTGVILAPFPVKQGTIIVTIEVSSDITAVTRPQRPRTCRNQIGYVEFGRLH